jgi:hypothetical protein
MARFLITDTAPAAQLIYPLCGVCCTAEIFHHPLTSSLEIGRTQRCAFVVSYGL